MAVKTLGVGGDYTTFTGAITGIATWDTLNVLDAGTYTELSKLPDISKTVSIVNVSGGQVILRTPVGQPIGKITGGPITVTWTGDFDMQIRSGGSSIKYHWELAGTAGANNRMIFDGCTFTSNYAAFATQVIYQQAGKSHEFHNCRFVGDYESLVTLATTAIDSVFDGAEIVGTTEYVVAGGAGEGNMFSTFDWRRIRGEVKKCPVYNTAGGAPVNVSTSGLLTTSQMWGMDGVNYTSLGAGPIAVEKSIFSGARADGFKCPGGVSTGVTFRDVGFGGFSGQAVACTISAIAGLIDYCGLFDGCPSFSATAGSVGAHNVTDDPVLVDAVNHDYRILSTSPWRDAGIACVATVDPDGTAIPQGSAPDIGVFELIPPANLHFTGGLATGNAEITITVDGDLTVAISNLADWSVTPVNPGDDAVNITSIVLGGSTSEAVITLDANMTPRADYVVSSTSTEFEFSYDEVTISALSVGARIVSAIFLDAYKQIIVTADETVTQGGTGALAHWSQTLHSTFGDTITLTDADVQGGSSVTIGLTYTGRPTPGARYQIVTDSAEFETGYKTVYAVMAIGAQDFTPEPLLPSLLSGVGKQLAYVVGNPQTVLTTALTPGDTVAYVESTLGFPDTNGVVYIGGTRLDYTAKTSYSFTGVVWPFVTIPGSPTTYRTDFKVFQIDTPVTDYSHEYCLEDAATNERIISRCTGSQLKRLVSSLGFTPPLATMLDTDIQDYANERMYQDTGTWQSIFRTLRPVLRELEPNGTAVVGAGPILDEVLITDSVQASMLVGRWMEVNGKIARIASVATGTGANCYDITFCDYDGLMWEDPDLASQIGTTVEWRLLLFTMYCDLTVMSGFPRAPGSLLNVQAGRWVVNLYTGGQVALTMPVGYWCADATFDMNGESALRPRHNYLAASHATIAVTNDRFLYLIDNYDYEVTALTGELVPAAVIPIVDVL